MNRINLMLSGLLLLPVAFQLQAGSKEFCADKESAQCQAYLAGLVEGYVTSKQNYLPKTPSFESSYEERAFANRVSQKYTSIDNKDPACLPKKVNKQEIVSHLMKSDKDATVELGDYLRKNYACSSRLSKR